MPDFFDTVVARAAGGLSLRPKVRPRLPELFEPPQPFLAEELEVDASDARPDSVAPVLDPVPPVVAPAPQVPPPAATSRAESTTSHVMTPPGPVPSPEIPVSPHVVRPFAEPPPTSRQVPARPLSPAPEVVPLRVERLTGAPVPPVPTAVERASARPTESRRERVRSERQEHARRTGGDRTEPVVRVSIGRLEVHTAPPAAEAERDRAPGRPEPAVSLADFLDRSGPGGR